MTRIEISGNNIITWSSDGPRLIFRKALDIFGYKFDLFVRKSTSENDSEK